MTNAVPDQFPDLRRALDEDEAAFARRFYREVWQHQEYQRARLLLSQEFLFPLNLPAGKVLMLGTHNGHVFDAWCRHWGHWRCVGIDLHNDPEHPNIWELDVRDLGPGHSLPVALAWNDIGSWSRTPEARGHSYRWTRDHVVPGGFYLERGDAVAGWALSEDMAGHGFLSHLDIWDGAYVLYRRREAPDAGA